MSENVITFVANGPYLNHARAFMVNARREGGYLGDFCLITPSDTPEIDFEQRGIHVFRAPVQGWNYLMKFWAFDPYFRRWKRALAIDLDVIVQGPLEPLFETLGARLPKIQADLEDGTTINGLRYWDPKAAEHEAVFQEIERRFPWVKERMFNAAFLFYEPAAMEDDTVERLHALAAEFTVINPAAADQMVMNLLLWNRMELAGKDAICFFGHDWPKNRVASDFRKWRGDEAPAILHYCGSMAPWIVKEQPTGAALQGLLDLGLTPETGGYQCHRLGRVCHELYQTNLAVFETEFPIR